MQFHRSLRVATAVATTTVAVLLPSATHAVASSASVQRTVVQTATAPVRSLSVTPNPNPAGLTPVCNSRIYTGNTRNPQPNRCFGLSSVNRADIARQAPYGYKLLAVLWKDIKYYNNAYHPAGYYVILWTAGTIGCKQGITQPQAYHMPTGFGDDVSAAYVYPTSGCTRGELFRDYGAWDRLNDFNDHTLAYLPAGSYVFLRNTFLNDQGSSIDFVRQTS